ncbi:MAG: DUF1572 family protein [Bacteroidota bacterium]|nr:DUF1572 family protein [Bacteroidota bacterium]
MSIEKDFLGSVIKRFKSYKDLGDKTFEQLDEKDFFIQPNAYSNSIAIIIQHLYGNMLSRWTNFLTEDGEKEWRKRDAEFETMQCSKQDLLSFWNEGWNCLLQTLESLREEDLNKIVHIRTEPLTVVDAIIRQLAHYSSHVGQIIYIGRWIKEDKWASLSVPKGQSDAYNESMKKREFKQP